jgi:hypothetical protein
LGKGGPLRTPDGSLMPGGHSERPIERQAQLSSSRGRAVPEQPTGYSVRNILSPGRVKRRVPEERDGEGPLGRRLPATGFGLGEGPSRITLTFDGFATSFGKTSLPPQPGDQGFRLRREHSPAHLQTSVYLPFPYLDSILGFGRSNVWATLTSRSHPRWRLSSRFSSMN